MFDDASDDIKWSRHPVPVIYGFKSYCSFPVYLEDGSFFGTLCAIDPAPRHVSRRGDCRDVLGLRQDRRRNPVGSGRPSSSRPLSAT